MTKIKIGKNEYSIYFAMQPTVQSGIVSKLAALETRKDWGVENFGDFLAILTELLLVGLQKNHKDEFGYNYLTGEGKDEALSKTFDLMDQFAEDTDSDYDYTDLFADLNEELLENGFFKKLFQKEQENEVKKSKAK